MTVLAVICIVLGLLSTLSLGWTIRYYTGKCDALRMEKHLKSDAESRYQSAAKRNRELATEIVVLQADLLSEREGNCILRDEIKRLRNPDLDSERKSLAEVKLDKKHRHKVRKNDDLLYGRR